MIEEEEDEMRRAWIKVSAFKEPVELSDPEREQIRVTIDALKSILDIVCDRAVKLSRLEAYELVARYIKMFKDAESALTIKEREKPSVVPKIDRIQSRPKPSLNDILSGLTSSERSKAERLLDCVKNARALEEDEEDPDQVLCPHCNVEEMRKCIATEDPSVVDEMDEDLREKMRTRPQD